jgi:hypothetical protein
MKVTYHFDLYPEIVDYDEIKEKAIKSSGKIFTYKKHKLKALQDGKTILRVIKVGKR